MRIFINYFMQKFNKRSLILKCLIHIKDNLFLHKKDKTRIFFEFINDQADNFAQTKKVGGKHIKSLFIKL